MLASLVKDLYKSLSSWIQTLDILMSLEHILLGALREPATGYELGKELAESAGHYWPAERSQIYPTLRRLQQRG